MIGEETYKQIISYFHDQIKYWKDKEIPKGWYFTIHLINIKPKETFDTTNTADNHTTGVAVRILNIRERVFHFKHKKQFLIAEFIFGNNKELHKSFKAYITQSPTMNSYPFWVEDLVGEKPPEKQTNIEEALLEMQQKIDRVLT
jgi:hypothetical protein